MDPQWAVADFSSFQVYANNRQGIKELRSSTTFLCFPLKVAQEILAINDSGPA